MKHSLLITIVLISVFFVAQVLGLTIIDQYIDKPATEESGELVYKELPLNLERPEVEEQYSYIYILLAVLIGTILILLLIRFHGVKLWKLWFFLAVWLCLTVAFTAFISQVIAAIIALLAAGYKIFRPNFIIHNLTEVFLYGGLAAIFVPVMNVFAAVVLLILISAYDMYAVWKSKHMVKMAEFQTQSKVFAGLSIPYKVPKLSDLKKIKKANKKGGEGKLVHKPVKSAILGGGDIGFPLLFAGVLMKQFGFLHTLIVPAVVTIALFALLYFAKKDRFYPAMPFVTAGCFAGWALLYLIF